MTPRPTKKRARNGARGDPATAQSAAHETPRAPWWGSGAPPWERWPGATLKLEAVWSDERDRWESQCGLYWFDAAAAERACLFFPTYMRHTTGSWAGKPFDLLPWQEMAIIRPLFGWKRVADDLRRFRTLFVEVAKKNGKTQLMSGLAMLLAFADNEPGAQVYAAAASDEQARILWNESSKSIRACPEFLSDAGVEVFKSSVVQASTESSFQVISSKVGTKHGFNVHGIIIDEFHTQQSRDLYDTLYKGTSARRQPMTILITTAGDDRESICYEEYERAKKVIAGAAEDATFLPVVFEMPHDADWTDERNWYLANPSLGVTKSLDYMRTECAAAKAEPRKRNSFLRLELNVWTESRTVWIAPEAWEACRRPAPATDLGELVSCVGLDLSSNQDLTALVVVAARPDEAGQDPVEVGDSLSIDWTLEIRPYFFLPREILRERARKDRIPYDVWEREGWLRATDGATVDYSEVLRVLVEEVKPEFPGLREVGYDPWNAMHLATSAIEQGVPMVEVRQGYATLSGPCKLLEALVLSGRVRHDGNPLMRWCVANCEVVSDPSGNIKPVKPGGESRGRRRIDGVVATVTGLSRLMLQDPGSSVYESRGLLVL